MTNERNALRAGLFIVLSTVLVIVVVLSVPRPQAVQTRFAVVVPPLLT